LLRSEAARIEREETGPAGNQPFLKSGFFSVKPVPSTVLSVEEEKKID
jgi:hypothetical protein